MPTIDLSSCLKRGQYTAFWFEFIPSDANAVVSHWEGLVKPVDGLPVITVRPIEMVSPETLVAVATHFVINKQALLDSIEKSAVTN